MCAVWFWRRCVLGQHRVLHSEGGGEDQGQGSCFLLQPQDQEVALPLLHHQAKAKGWPLRSPSVSCRGCGDPRGGLHDQGVACCAREGPHSGVMWWCDAVMNWIFIFIYWVTFGKLDLVVYGLLNWIYGDASNVLCYLYLSVLKFACGVWLVLFRCCELWV